MKKNFHKTPTGQFILIIFLLISLPILIFAVQLVLNMVSRAGGTRANLVIDYNSNLGKIPPVWQALSQGGEEKTDMLTPAVNDVRTLSPKYIRLDHLYDLYDVVSRGGDGRLNYDFSQLDRTVNSILQTGALPFFSISYMPTDLSTEDITGKPKNWQEWSDVVRATIEHYSGKTQKNLNGVYYEIWNEPDLFGRWNINGTKSYSELYYYSVQGANAARNVNQFKIGGPTTTGMYPNWIKGLIEYSQKNNLRLDFLSFHRYSKDMEVFTNDGRGVQEILDQYPAYKNLEIIVSEWGSDSENSPDHDGVFDAAHTIAAVRQFTDRITWAFSFEVKDGPADQEYWGRWGILTHEKYGLHKKPKFFALKFLNNLEGDRLKIDGEGSWVTALAAKKGDNLKTIIVNYDPRGTHWEDVPLKFNNLPNANYLLKISYLFGGSKDESFRVTSGFIDKIISLKPQNVVLIELTKLAPEYSFSLGYFNDQENRGLALTNKDLPLRLNRENFVLPQNGGMDFFLKPLWKDTTEPLTLLSIQLDNGRQLMMRKEKSGFGERLSWGVYKDGLAQNTVLSPLDWKIGQWHHVGLTWSLSGLAIFVDGKKIQESQSGVNFSLSGSLLFANFGGVIDELRVVGQPYTTLAVPTMPYGNSPDILFLRHFNGTVEK